MKKWLMVLVSLVAFRAHGQHSIIQTMIKQIALLQTYIGSIEKGYDLAKKGLNTIGASKSRHWNLDIDFFNSLKVVNPKIAGYSKVIAIVELRDEISKRCQELRQIPVNQDERQYIGSVSEFLLNEAATIVDFLETVLEDRALTMSDDERISTIDDIYEEISSQYQFISSFLNQTKLLAAERKKEENESRVFRKLINDNAEK